MRIARFSPPGGSSDPQFGVVQGELDQFGQADDDATVVALAGDPIFSGVNPTGETYRLAEVKLLAPVIPRSKVVAVARNYAEHAAEFGNDVPEQPLFFIKPNTSVIGPGDTIVRPAGVERLDYEGELAIVIGRICKDVPATLEDVSRVIYGMTVGNDVTARDLQRGPDNGHFTRAKGFDSFCPLGPWIETEVDLEGLKTGVGIQTFLNGEVVQDGDTSHLVFDIPTLIAHVSSVMTLLPGDVVLTGTPAGVGPMEPGDEIEVSIAGLGTLFNKVGTK